MKKAVLIFLTIACAITATLHAFAQNDSTGQRITLRNISASIIPPKHFVYDSITDKITHPGTLTSIQINEVRNRNYKKITAAMTEKYIASQGFALIDKFETKMQNGEDAKIYRCSFRSNDDKGKEIDFIRLMLFTGTENTIWITVDFPECMEKLIETPIIGSITSVQKF